MADEDAITISTDEEVRLAGTEEIAEEADQPSETPEENQEEQAEQPEVTEDETPEEEVNEEESPTEEPPKLSRRQELAIQKILGRTQPKEKPQPSQPVREDALDYGRELDADPEVIQRLQADREAEGQRQYNAGLEQAKTIEWRTSLKIDAPTVEKKYPILDKNSEDFHPGVANAINQWYLDMSGFDPDTGMVANPNISYEAFADGFMELVEETAGQKTAKATQNIAKQAAQTGLRPDGSSAKRLNLNQAPEKMTLEELYAKIGQKPPKQ